MACLRPLLSFSVVITCMLLLFFLPSPSSSSDDESRSTAVTLSLYYETLCPFCANFIVNRLEKVFDGDLISIVNLRMIPWGNSFVQSDGSFVCQHGPDECFLNAIEACAIATYPDVERHFRFIHCIESLALENKLNEWVNCFEVAGLGNEVVDCYTSGNGNMHEQQFAAETSQLNPPHRFVPWIVVNNQPLQEDFENFVSYVCKAYTGTRVPGACRSLPSEANSLLKENPITSVCFAHKIDNSTTPIITTKISKINP